MHANLISHKHVLTTSSTDNRSLATAQGVFPKHCCFVVVVVVVVVAVVVFVAATAHSAGQSGSGFKEAFIVGDIERSFLHVSLPTCTPALVSFLTIFADQ